MAFLLPQVCVHRRHHTAYKLLAEPQTSAASPQDPNNGSLSSNSANIVENIQYINTIESILKQKIAMKYAFWLICCTVL